MLPACESLTWNGGQGTFALSLLSSKDTGLARKILLADDSVTAQNMGRKILTDAGYDVVTVNNGSAALKRVAELTPDLVVLDVYMPGYSGLEVCARLKDAPETSRIPILLTVGKLEPFKPEEATRVRADGFIVKPFEASELLSALTRLEDRMVPAQSDGSRFSTSVSGIERFSGGSDPMTKKSSGDESDTGWKNRLRFPSKKKKEPEPEPEAEPDFVTPTSFREFRRGVGKPPAGSSPFPLSTAPPPGQEPGLVPDIPRDITPEELDALSDLVAKLDGPAAGPEDVRPVSETIRPLEAAAPEAKIEVAAASAPAEVEKDVTPPAAVEMQSQVAALLENSGVPAATEARVDAVATTAATEEKTVAQEPAPEEKKDEQVVVPIAAESETAPAAQSEAPIQEAASSEPVAPAIEAQAEPKIEATVETEKTKVEECASAAEVPEPTPVASAQHKVPEEPSPSAEELAEALRFLTPSQTSASQSLAEAGAALADELSRGSVAGNGNRWVAEAMAVSSDEASGSLEAEMFRTFASSSGEQGKDAAPSNGTGGEAAAASSEGTAEMRSEASAFTAAEVSLASAIAESVQVEAQSSNSSVKQTDEAPEEAAGTTFADAIRQEETESVAASAQAAGGTQASTQDSVVGEGSISDNGGGGQETMGKETKGKGGKSTWHEIRPAAPALNNALEAAKQPEESPKTMAAAAAADNASDAGSIASIVDSVLADLRPRIVEEIAKKLAKK